MLPSVNKINLKNFRDPFFIYKPINLKKSVNYFIKNFSGEALYAVKANPSEFISSMNELNDYMRTTPDVLGMTV